MAFVKYSEGKINSIVKEEKDDSFFGKLAEEVKKAKELLKKYEEMKKGKLDKEND